MASRTSPSVSRCRQITSASVSAMLRAALEIAAERGLADMKLPGGLVYTHTLDMRFVGQAFEVGVEIPAGKLASLDATSATAGS